MCFWLYYAFFQQRIKVFQDTNIWRKKICVFLSTENFAPKWHKLHQNKIIRSKYITLFMLFCIFCALFQDLNNFFREFFFPVWFLIFKLTCKKYLWKIKPLNFTQVFSVIHSLNCVKDFFFEIPFWKYDSQKVLFKKAFKKKLWIFKKAISL